MFLLAPAGLELFDVLPSSLPYQLTESARKAPDAEIAVKTGKANVDNIAKPVQRLE